MAKKEKKQQNCRLGKVGGQAVIEGVMMKSGDNMAIASRMPDGSIKVPTVLKPWMGVDVIK
jgi:uncharacterized protein YqhQ